MQAKKSSHTPSLTMAIHRMSQHRGPKNDQLDLIHQSLKQTFLREEA